MQPFMRSSSWGEKVSVLAKGVSYDISCNVQVLFKALRAWQICTCAAACLAAWRLGCFPRICQEQPLMTVCCCLSNR